jgi:hypothetical protein
MNCGENKATKIPDERLKRVFRRPPFVINVTTFSAKTPMDCGKNKATKIPDERLKRVFRRPPADS